MVYGASATQGEFMWLLGMLSLLGCVTKAVDRITVDRIVGQAKVIGDTQMPCALGESLNHVLMATGNHRTQPDLALVISNGTAGICAQQQAWEEHLRAVRAKTQRPLDDPYRIAEIKDAQYSAARWDAIAARRFYQAFKHSEVAFDGMDVPCSTLKKKDEVAYLVGLISGTFAVLHDKQIQGEVGVPVDLLPKIARASSCLDNERWWHVPQALQGGIWATIPGSGPSDIDPWEHLVDAGTRGSASGVRVAYAIGALLANNAGESKRLHDLLVAHGEALKAQEPAMEWVFFDQYATEVSLFQSDQVWTSETGHRTPELGELPRRPEKVPEAVSNDPFSSEPSDDPFGQ